MQKFSKTNNEQSTTNQLKHIQRAFPFEGQISQNVSKCTECTIRHKVHTTGSPPYEGGVAAASADGVVLVRKSKLKSQKAKSECRPTREPSRLLRSALRIRNSAFSCRPLKRAPRSLLVVNGRDRLRILQHWRFYDARTPTALRCGKPPRTPIQKKRRDFSRRLSS